MRKRGVLKHIDFILLDIGVLVVSYILSLYIRGLSVSTFSGDVYKSLVVYELLAIISCDYFYNPYEDIIKRNFYSIAYSQLIFTILQVAMVSLLLFTNKNGELISRGAVGIEYILFFVLSLVVKYFWKKHLKTKSLNSTLSGEKGLLVITNSNEANKILDEIKDNNLVFYRVVGLCILDKDEVGSKYEGYDVVCTKDDLLSYICANWVDEVYFNLNYDKIDKNLLSGIATMGVTIHIRLSNIEGLIGQEQTVEKLFNLPTLTSCVKQRTNKQVFRKQLMDFTGGIVGSLITIILTIFIGPIIKIKSPKGPIFYKQERIGLNGRHFYMYKFRSMIPDAEKHLDELKDKNIVSSDLMFKMEDDPRIIPGIGNFIRKTSLDEFPQFFNVLKGDMSLVGTRPPTVDEWEKYDLKHRIRMSIKPGITGLWQVSGRNSITDFDEVVKLDAEYIRNWHIGLDIKIIWKTVKVLFERKKSDKENKAL